MNNVKEWLTLKEACEITGKSMSALRMVIKRKKDVKAKKILNKSRNQWVIHKDELKALGAHVHLDVNLNKHGEHVKVNTITIEYYDQQRDRWEEERSKIEQGMLMYRIKFEELDRKLKLLPAPVEMVAADLEKKEKDISEIQNKLKNLEEEKQKADVESAELNKKIEGLSSLIEEKEKAEKLIQNNLEEEKRAKNEIEAAYKAEKSKSWWRKIFG